MVERESQGGFIPGEKVKIDAAARHLRVYEKPEHLDLELSDRRIAILILAKDTGIPIIKRTLEMIEAKYDIK